MHPAFPGYCTPHQPVFVGTVALFCPPAHHRSHHRTPQSAPCPRPPTVWGSDLPLWGPRPPAVGDPDLMLWGNSSPPPTASSPNSIKGTLSSLPTLASPPGLTFLWATDSFLLHLNSLPSPRHLISAATPLPTCPAYIHIHSEHLVHLLLGFLTLCLLSARGS